MVIRILCYSIVFLNISCAPQLSLIDATKDSSQIIDASMAEDAEVLALIGPYKAQLDNELNLMIGQAAHRMGKQPVESNLGNFIADALLREAQKYTQRHLDFGLIHQSELAAAIPIGPVRKKDIYELMPVESGVYVLELSHRQIQALMTYCAQQQNLAFSNAVMVLKNQQLVQFYIDGQPVAEEKTYTLAVSEFLATGGEGLNFLKQAKTIAKLDGEIQELIIQYIVGQQTEGKVLNATIEGRVKVIQ